jgi:AcrR family transcriptional regulator
MSENSQAMQGMRQNRCMDPRVARTTASLQQALLELARQHPLDDITIGDITERAGVNRSSFYQHYSDKETLLADALEDAVSHVASHVPTSVADPPRMPEELHVYLEHIEENAPLYRRILGDQGSAVVASRLRDRIEVIVRELLDAAGTGVFDGLPSDVAAASIAGSALGVIRAWVQREPLPPVEVAAGWLFQALLGPSEIRQQATGATAAG